MVLTSPLPYLLLLLLSPTLTLALARPQSLIPPHKSLTSQISEEAKAGLILRTLAAIEHETRHGRTIDFEALLSEDELHALGLGTRAVVGRDMEGRQLLGGGREYAPYAMPCPEGLEWVRSAQVSPNFILPFSHVYHLEEP